MKMERIFKSGYESGYKMTKPNNTSGIGAAFPAFFPFNV